MDEIDGMNSGDKGGINTLIKLIRPKKTKKQKKEETTMTPIVCIGSCHIDKKIKEMIKICVSIKLELPTNNEVNKIIGMLMPKLENELKEKMVLYIDGDLRKLKSTYDIYKNQESILKNQLVQNMFQQKNYNEDVKNIIKKLLNNNYNLDQHNELMNETDRTSVGLLYHENIIDVLEHIPKENAIPFYNKILNNVCFSDYIDRITFQKQIWIFNEMSSLIKTLYNNHLYQNKYIHKKKHTGIVRFTKVLTKYSTEYNNSVFMQDMCRKFHMDQKDLLCYFYNLKQTKDIDEIIDMFEKKGIINKLETVRMFRYIDSCY